MTYTGQYGYIKTNECLSSVLDNKMLLLCLNRTDVFELLTVIHLYYRYSLISSQCI